MITIVSTIARVNEDPPIEEGSRLLLMKLAENLLRPFKLCDHILREVQKLTASVIARTRRNELKAIARRSRLLFRFSLKLGFGLSLGCRGVGTGLSARRFNKLRAASAALSFLCSNLHYLAIFVHPASVL